MSKTRNRLPRFVDADLTNAEVDTMKEIALDRIGRQHQPGSESGTRLILSIT
ncbi:MAG: hypothetical protein OXE78_00990 [Gammaproteobacteria bacterium]|nr:hypothetical protein [Gammaproteobacteria bacterium]MCY4357617.1 hypothetical protein [Gammaproteobacteria bacterium]